VYNKFFPVKEVPHIMLSPLLTSEEISVLERGTAGRACQKILLSVCCLKFRKLQSVECLDHL